MNMRDDPELGSMELCHGYQHIKMQLSATRKYDWTEIKDMCSRVTGPFWLHVEGTLVPIKGNEILDFACQVSAAYHDYIAYNAPYDDGFSADMREREALAEEEGA